MKNLINYLKYYIKVNFLKHKAEKIIANNKEHLQELIEKEINKHGYKCSLNHIDTSKITDLSYIFYRIQDFNGDISQWDLSNVKNISHMFAYSKFNGDISKWNVSNVENMNGVFTNSNFNSDISQWDVSNVTDMSNLFYSSSFNKNISQWNVSKVTDMKGMFSNSEFNQDISNWDVSNVIDLRWIFDDSKFKGNIDNWDVRKLILGNNYFSHFLEKSLIKPPIWYQKNTNEAISIIEEKIMQKHLKEIPTTSKKLKI